MNIKKLLAAVIVAAGFTSVAHASHLGTIGSIDQINATFGNGGGTWTGSLANGVDNAWVVFHATAGDTLSISVDAPAYKNAMLLTDPVDGTFAVGDALDISNFNIGHVGEGSALKVLATIGSYEFSGLATLSWTAAYTGEYGIVINAANDDDGWAGGPMTVGVTGATFNENNVPEPASLALLGLGLAGLAGARRRQKANG